ncbi:nuclear pore complex protein NUP214-like [Quercus robur]|uniref:nuclear pore complex protein NUP214-like n=1 Tax=Quercus robur TaxID=38942 RepID=UPI0021611A82|nr:nuclear pore complex protein NUP214-like [Quercus robur]
MVPNPASLTRKFLLSYSFMGFSRRPISHSTRIPANPIQISGFRTCSSCRSYSHPLNSGHGAKFKNLGSSEMRFGQLCFDHFLVSVVSDGGSGGYGGFGGRGEGSGGGSGDGGAGSNDSSGGNKSLLLW